jgi:hypothetical protein
VTEATDGKLAAVTAGCPSIRLRHGPCSHQHREGGETPGVPVAPVAFAGGIMPGFPSIIVTLSRHDAEFGVGTTSKLGPMLVPTSAPISGRIAPGDELSRISGIESGKAAPLLGGPPGVELHPVVDALPSGNASGIVPVVLRTIGVGTDPNGTEPISGANAAGLPDAICPEGPEPFTTVPGIVGSEASGAGARVVSGALPMVVAENGLGPLSGEITIAPGVDGSPMAVVPVVETCARLALHTSSRTAIVSCKLRIAVSPFMLKA